MAFQDIVVKCYLTLRNKRFYFVNLIRCFQRFISEKIKNFVTKSKLINKITQNLILILDSYCFSQKLNSFHLDMLTAINGSFDM